MPPREITSSEERSLADYNALGTPEHIRAEIKRLRKENGTYRTITVPALEKQIADAAKVPEGGRIISKEEAADLDAWKALKKTPKEVADGLKELETTKVQLNATTREANRDRAAKTLNLEGKDLAVFNGINDLDFTVESEEVEENGAKVKRDVAYAIGADKKKVKLLDFGKEKWGRGFENLLTTAQLQAPTGVPWAPQSNTQPANQGKMSDGDYKAKVTEATVAYNI
jgi:hypothetical protein